MANKLKLTPARHQEIVELVRAGAYLAHAAAVAGVHPDTVDNWVARGEKADADEPFKSFAADLRRAQAEDIVRNVTTISKAAHGRDAETIVDAAGKKHVIPAKDAEWKAAAWLAERKHPKLYAMSELHKEEHRKTLAAFRHVCTPEQFAAAMKLLAEMQ